VSEQFNELNEFELKIKGSYRTSYLYVDDEENRAYEFDDRIAEFNPVTEKTSGGMNYIKDFFCLW